jgi:dipeptidyl aminopeptidase/acylaminoacyl peptidase
MRRLAPILLVLTSWSAVPAAGQGPARRLVTLDDLHTLKGVVDPQLSPEGDWVAYSVSEANRAEDEYVSDIWMTSWDGRTTLRLTNTPKGSEHAPRWSPDGHWLSFLSSRGESDDANQLWLMDRRGGEAAQVTAIKAGISDYAWSPDGRRLVFVIEDRDTVETTDVLPADSSGMAPDSARAARDSAGRTTAPPIVIDRFYFKEDYTGYVRRKRKHLYLFTLATRRLEQLTAGDVDDLLPSWSPDGQYLAFVSKRVGTDPDRANNWDVWVIQAAKGAVARPLTTFTGPDADPAWESRPVWSPDGRFIAYLQGGPDSLIYYAGPRVAVISWAARGNPLILTAALDRNATAPRWSADGKFLYFLLEDDRAVLLARMPAQGGPVERVIEGRLVVDAFTVGPEGRIAALLEAPDHPAEVVAAEGTALRPLSHQNDSLLAQLRLAPVEEISTRSRDGTVVNGFLVQPTAPPAGGGKVPTILNIHGGPVSQFQDDFNFYWQLLAAEGYAVVAMNPRGSSGRGEKFALAIWADWGNRDAQDVLAGVDYAVKLGLADPARLGVGGWSYGGMLTNYVIAQDTRFKAAVSGASISDILAGYGTDMYVREYEAELGPPWKNTQTWIKLSFPFLHADRIRTPTLFLCGARDFNVPLLNSEQMYEALRSLGVPTRLVIYPNSFHGLSLPSYQRHRWAQYLRWYGEYLKPRG